GEGLGPIRTTGAGADEVHERVPLNAPALWNLAHKSITSVFHDGRLAVSDSHPSGFQGPAGDNMLHGLETIIAAQALFPPTSATEMAGQGDENDVALATAEGMHNVWPILAARVAAIPEYETMFTEVYDHVENADDITYVDIANAIAAFIGTEFTNHDSPFDQYLAGDKAALNDAEKRGMQLFFGEAGCASCHSGPLLSDQAFHAIGLPQFGPGRTTRFDPLPRDVGRMALTHDLSDAYRFKTPFLRNVALTAPYGHNGAMPTLEAMVRHHFDPVASHEAWTAEMAALRPAGWLAEKDFAILDEATETARHLQMIDIALPAATDEDIAYLVAFLHALTGDTAEARPLGVPERVPSGLPVD
ncbi:MAG: cytochrome c peroxidase, partial [Pseudomonadota bacterium]